MIIDLIEIINDTTDTWDCQGLNIWELQEPSHNDNLINLVIKLNYHNHQIWHNEDVCRSNDNSLIPNHKRAIDKHNQLRNNTIELIDEEFIKSQRSRFSSKINSETLGSIIDRISITKLKIIHLEHIISGLDEDLRPKHELKLFDLKSQYNLLKNCAYELYEDMINGHRICVVFKQHKQYNDPVTNRYMKE